MNYDRWALVGLERSGRHLVERWSVRADFPLVAACDPSPERRAWAQRRNLPTAARLADLLDEHAVEGVIMSATPHGREDELQLAMQRGLRILVEDGLAPSPVEARRLHEEVSAARLNIGVFQVGRSDQEFAAAQEAIMTQRLGRLMVLRYASCQFGLGQAAVRTEQSPDWKQTLAQSGAIVFEQLMLLTGQVPEGVEAWADEITAGFHARIETSGGATAWIDLQRRSLPGLQTGWVLEGTAGAYRAGRLYTLAEDGELLEETISPRAHPHDDAMCELRRLATDPEAARQSLARSLHRAALHEAIERSIAAGCRVDVAR